MFFQAQSLNGAAPYLPPSVFLPANSFPLSKISVRNPHSFRPASKPVHGFGKHYAFSHTLKCYSVVSEPVHLESAAGVVLKKPLPAEVSRTIMELCSVGTLSTLSPQDSWPFAIGVRFAVDDQGTPILCLGNNTNTSCTSKNTSSSNTQFSLDDRSSRSSFNVQVRQCGLRTPQCTIQGTLNKPRDPMLVKKLRSIWKKKFGEEMNEDLIYIISVEQVIQMEDFMEDGIWVSSFDYKTASPDPLRHFAERIVDEINTHNKEDVHRFCNVYVDVDFLISEAKLVWVDRLGFDMRLKSIENQRFEVRIPFPREVTDEKGVKSTFNGMSQLAWEVEKNYCAPDFNKVKQLKKLSS